MVLLTDGEDLESNGLEAAKRAGEAGITIETVGVGTPAGELVPATNDQGVAVGLVRDDSGAPVRSRLDEPGLRAIAQAAHGTTGRSAPTVAASTDSTTRRSRPFAHRTRGARKESLCRAVRRSSRAVNLRHRARRAAWVAASVARAEDGDRRAAEAHRGGRDRRAGADPLLPGARVRLGAGCREGLWCRPFRRRGARVRGRTGAAPEGRAPGDRCRHGGVSSRPLRRRRGGLGHGAEVGGSQTAAAGALRPGRRSVSIGRDDGSASAREDERALEGGDRRLRGRACTSADGRRRPLQPRLCEAKAGRARKQAGPPQPQENPANKDGQGQDASKDGIGKDQQGWGRDEGRSERERLDGSVFHPGPMRMASPARAREKGKSRPRTKSGSESARGPGRSADARNHEATKPGGPSGSTPGERPGQGGEFRESGTSIGKLSAAGRARATRLAARRRTSRGELRHGGDAGCDRDAKEGLVSP